MAAMRPLLISAAVLATLVAILGVLIGLEVPAVINFDLAVAQAVRYKSGGTFQVNTLQVLTSPGLTVFRLLVLLPIAVMFALRRQLRMLGFIILAGATVGPLTVLLKAVVGRVRPNAADRLVAAGGMSYPSGHSSGAAALAGMLIVALWPVVGLRWRPWLIGGLSLLALTVAWTRMALGVHYLTDVVGGLALGVTVVLVSMLIFGIYPGGPGQLPQRGWPKQALRSGRAERSG